MKYALYKILPVPWIENDSVESFYFKNDIIIVSSASKFLCKWSELMNECLRIDDNYFCKDIYKLNKYDEENECIINAFINDTCHDLCVMFRKTIPVGNSVITRLNKNEWRVMANSKAGVTLKLKCGLNEYEIMIMNNLFCVQV